MIIVPMLTPFFTGKLSELYNVIMELVPVIEGKEISTNILLHQLFGNLDGQDPNFKEKSKNFKIYRFDSYLNLRNIEFRLSYCPFY